MFLFPAEALPYVHLPPPLQSLPVPGTRPPVSPHFNRRSGRGDAELAAAIAGHAAPIPGHGPGRQEESDGQVQLQGGHLQDGDVVRK